MSSISKRLFAVLGVMIGATLPSEAAVVFFPGAEIPIPTTFAGVSVNLETGATTNALAGGADMDANFFLGGEGISNDADENAPAPTWQPVRTGTANTDDVDNLTFGTIVGPGSVYATDFGGSADHFLPFVNGASGYIGFSLEIAGPATVYGWMRVTLQDDNTPGVIHEWAYQDDGSPLAVGAIPEPSHALLTVLGLATLALRRRR